MESRSKDRTGWLGWEDSNSGIQRSRLSNMVEISTSLLISADEVIE
jgi:hypothetical protein